MDKIAKNKIFMFYAVMTLVMGLIGALANRKIQADKNPSMDSKKALMMGAMSGMAAGAVLSVILWFAWGKHNSY